MATISALWLAEGWGGDSPAVCVSAGGGDGGGDEAWGRFGAMAQRQPMTSAEDPFFFVVFFNRVRGFFQWGFCRFAEDSP
jgi:hypothetical protein